MAIILVALTLILASANGANDVSKGVATLVGSGVTRLRNAVWWGTLWTMAGAVAAACVSQGLVAAFSGQGLLPQGLPGHTLLVSVAIGAILWVLCASLTGMPVSTTHSIIGALCGAAVMGAGPQGVQWAVVGHKFALPLLISPLLSIACMRTLFPAIRFCFGRFQRYCVCVEVLRPVAMMPSASLAAVTLEGPGMGGMRVGESASCGADPEVVSRLNLMDALHWASAGLTSFARGMNDTPKILALGVAAAALSGLGQFQFYLLVGAAMGLGSLAGGFRVTETLAHKVTRMPPEEGFSANLITSSLVSLASHLALPVSTTHVSGGAIMGVGLHQGGRSLQWKTVREMLLAWLVTLPVSAAFGLGAYALISKF